MGAKMIKKGVACLVLGSLVATSCAAQNEQASSEGQTVAEGAILGTLLGAGLGAAFGGGRGAAIGAAAGALLGTAAGGYVAEQKKKYATIEQRIAGERQIAAQATATAQSQIAASRAELAVVDAQLNDLSRTRADIATARDRTTPMLAGLQNRRSQLESQRKQLETSLKNQQAFIAETEQEMGTNDPQKTAQLAQWKAEIPPMQAAIAGMTSQISDNTAMETRVEQIKSL
jgi:outer membrane lipoprotein SlyB